jgi:predicted nucleic acid-binding protein
VILVDTNILMYAGGTPHAYKEPCIRLLDRIASGAVDAAVDAEALQEILHRYRAIKRWSDGKRVYDLARQIVVTVIPVTSDVVDLARDLLDEHHGLSARDALHAAVYKHTAATALCSYDVDFDVIKGIRRLEPNRVK